MPRPRSVALVSVLVVLVFAPMPARGGALGQLEGLAGRSVSSVHVPEPIPCCAYCGVRMDRGGAHRSSCPYAAKPRKPTGSSHGGKTYKPKPRLSTNQQIMVQSCGMIMQSLFANLFSSGNQSRAQAEKARLIAEQQARIREMQERQRREAEAARKKGVAAWKACQERHGRERAAFLEEEYRRLDEIANSWKGLGANDTGALPGAGGPRFHMLGEGGQPMPSAPADGGMGGWKEPGTALTGLTGSMEGLREGAGLDFDGGVAHGDASVVDLRHLGDEPGVVDPKDLGRSQGDTAPAGESLSKELEGSEGAKFPSEAPAERSADALRRRRLAGLSDEALEAEIARTRRVIEQIGAQGRQDAANLKQWSEENQKAQLEAFELCAGKLVEIAEGKALKAVAATGKAGLAAVQSGQAAKLVAALNDARKQIAEAQKNPGDPASREKILTAIHDSIQKSADFCTSDEMRALFEKSTEDLKVLPIAGEAKFFVDYGEQAMEWWRTRTRIEEVLRRQEGPRSQLETQRRISELYKAELAEYERRKTAAR